MIQRRSNSRTLSSLSSLPSNGKAMAKSSLLSRNRMELVSGNTSWRTQWRKWKSYRLGGKYATVTLRSWRTTLWKRMPRKQPSVTQSCDDDILLNYLMILKSKQLIIITTTKGVRAPRLETCNWEVAGDSFGTCSHSCSRKLAPPAKRPPSVWGHCF